MVTLWLPPLRKPSDTPAVKMLRTTVIAICCCLLLSFNTLAAALLAVEQCMQDAQDGSHQMADMADLHDGHDMPPHHDCAGDDQGLISATAQLLCDQGGGCEMGGAVVPSAVTLPAGVPEHVPAVFASIGLSPSYPTAFWRPPRL